MMTSEEWRKEFENFMARDLEKQIEIIKWRLKYRSKQLVWFTNMAKWAQKYPEFDKRLTIIMLEACRAELVNRINWGEYYLEALIIDEEDE